MKILIAGGTGLIGRRLIDRLQQDGHSVVLLSRHPKKHDTAFPDHTRLVEWDGKSAGAWTSEMDTIDAVINLAGENIGQGRWTAARKKHLLDSRLDSTRAIVKAIEHASKKPEVLLNASAVGVYGNVPEGACSEDHAPGKDFLAHICVEWEKAALEAEQFGVRVALPRTGIVLDTGGGALAKLLLPFKLFAGGPLGSGKQWFPWVHLEDEVGAIIHAMNTKTLRGPFNVAAPEVVRMKEFTRVLGTVMHRPSWAPVPGFVLKIILGEMAGPLLLSGQQAVPEKLLQSGYAFSFPRLRDALEHLLRKYL